MARSSSLPALQALRAGACLMVVFYHALQRLGGEAAITAWPNLSAGVDLFFVLSGYVMMLALSRRGPGPASAARFLAERLLRILPLYWGLTLLKLALIAVNPNLAPHTRPTLWQIAASFLFIPARDGQGLIRPIIAVGWTLNFEMLFYLLLALTLTRQKPRPLAILPVLGALTLAGFFRTPQWPAPLSLANGLVAEFAMGMLIFRLRPSVPRWVILPAFLLLLALPLAGPWRFLVWGLPAAAIVAVAAQAPGETQIPRPLVELGDASYAIYLLHGFLLPPLGAMLGSLISLPAGILLNRSFDAKLRTYGQKRLSVWLDRRFA